MFEKNLDGDFLCIKEFSTLVGISVPTLRNYDRKGVLRPAKRGKGFENNYRYYTLAQMATAKMVRFLGEIGVPLETIENLSQHRTPDKLMKLFKSLRVHRLHGNISVAA